MPAWPNPISPWSAGPNLAGPNSTAGRFQPSATTPPTFRIKKSRKTPIYDGVETRREVGGGKKSHAMTDPGASAKARQGAPTGRNLPRSAIGYQCFVI